MSGTSCALAPSPLVVISENGRSMLVAQYRSSAMGSVIRNDGCR
jgi:hypothetical protein